MTDAIHPEFSRKTRVSELNGRAARSVSAKASAEERGALGDRFGAVAVPRMSFSAQIAPLGDGWRVTGVARARVTHSCVVTLANVDQIIEERFERVFTPDAPIDGREADIDPEAADPPELLGDSIDIGEIAAESVALALDAYPRAPEAELPVSTAAPPGAKPLTEVETRSFAALAGLRDKLT